MPPCSSSRQAKATRNVAETFTSVPGNQMNNIKSLSARLLVMATAITCFSSTGAAQNNYTRLDNAERAACIRASGFIGATVSPRKVGFSDDVGYDIRLVSGVYPQKYMKGARGRMLCAYKRGGGRVEVQEFQGW
jgi:hypothetical protein